MSRLEEFRSLLCSFLRSMDPLERRPPAWDIALVPQTLSGPLSPCRHAWSVVLDQATHLRLALASTRRWTTSALCRIDSLIPGSGVRYPFLSSRPPWQILRIPPPLLLGLRAFLYWPYQRESNRNGRLLYPVRAARFYLVHTAPHRLRCERLFVSAGCST